MRFFRASEDAGEEAKPTEAQAKSIEEQTEPTEEQAKPAEEPIESGDKDGEEHHVSNVQATLTKVMDSIDGTIGVALVDFDGGLTLGTVGGGDELNLDIAGAGNLQVVRAKMRVMEQLGLDDRIEDILITLGGQYHLIRPLEKHPSMFLYLAIYRDQGNLGLARHQLRSLEAELVI